MRTATGPSSPGQSSPGQLDDLDAPGDAPRSVPASSPPPSALRAALVMARVEAWLLFRSPLVVAGLLVGALLVHQAIGHQEPLWWAVDWQIGYGQVILSGCVLAASHLAVSRARRDNLEEVYRAAPMSALTRTVAHLLGLLGVVPASAALIAGTTWYVGSRHVLGRPDPAVLAAGVVLVLAGGAVGVALGRLLARPVAGLLGALVWFIPYAQSNRVSDAFNWLPTWTQADQLNQLPNALAGYPPGLAHAVELAGIAMLAAVIALVVGKCAAPMRAGLLGAAAVSVAVILLACAAEMRPVPTSTLNAIVADVSHPVSVEHCTSSGAVRACVYPEFESQLPSLERAIDAVVDRVPAPAGGALTISQSLNFSVDASMTYGHSAQLVRQWAAEQQSAPGTQPSSIIYLPVGSWPTGAQVAVAQFDAALAAAEWAVGLTPAVPATGPQNQACVAYDQAREAVAIWLALQGSHLSSSQARSSSGGGGSVADFNGLNVLDVGGPPLRAWAYPGENASYVAEEGPPLTDAGYLLAQAMASLPSQKVAGVVDASWAAWTNWRTTDAQLAAALGISAPSAPPVTFTTRGGQVVSAPPGAIPQSPICT